MTGIVQLCSEDVSGCPEIVGSEDTTLKTIKKGKILHWNNFTSVFQTISAPWISGSVPTLYKDCISVLYSCRGEGKWVTFQSISEMICSAPAFLQQKNPFIRLLGTSKHYLDALVSLDSRTINKQKSIHIKRKEKIQAQDKELDFMWFAIEPYAHRQTGSHVNTLEKTRDYNHMS